MLPFGNKDINKYKFTTNTNNMKKNFNFEIDNSQFVTREGKIVGPFQKLNLFVLHNTLNIWKCKTTGKHYCESGAEIDPETNKAYYNTKKTTILRKATENIIEASKLSLNEQSDIDNYKNKIEQRKIEKISKQFIESKNIFKMKSPKIDTECNCPSCQASKLSLSNGINTTLVSNIYAVYNYMVDGLKVDKNKLINLPDMLKTPVIIQRTILKKLISEYLKYSNNDNKTLESLIVDDPNISDIMIEKFFNVDDLLTNHGIMPKADRNELSNNEQNNLEEFTFANFLHRESRNKADQSREKYIDIIIHSISDLEKFKKLKVLINDNFTKFENADLKMFKDFIINLCIEAPKYTKLQNIIIHLNIEEYLDNDDSPISIAINKYPTKKEIRKASDKMFNNLLHFSKTNKPKLFVFKNFMFKVFPNEVLEKLTNNIKNNNNGSIYIPKKKYKKVLSLITTELVRNNFNINIKIGEDQILMIYTPINIKQ